MPLHASHVRLIGRFAPSGFVFCARILGRFAPSGFVLRTRILSRFTPWIWALRLYLCSQKFSKNKSVSQSSHIALKHIMCKNIFTSLTHYALCAKPKRQSAILPTPCHSQVPKDCPCQVSCRLDHNCGI